MGAISFTLGRTLFTACWGVLGHISRDRAAFQSLLGELPPQILQGKVKCLPHPGNFLCLEDSVSSHFPTQATLFFFCAVLKTLVFKTHIVL